MGWDLVCVCVPPAPPEKGEPGSEGGRRRYLSICVQCPHSSKCSRRSRGIYGGMPEKGWFVPRWASAFPPRPPPASPGMPKPPALYFGKGKAPSLPRTSLSPLYQAMSPHLDQIHPIAA